MMSVVSANFRPAGIELEEPDWKLLVPDNPGKAQDHRALRASARKKWAKVVGQIRDAGLLAPENGEMILRLVLAYVRYEWATSQMFMGRTMDCKNPSAEASKANYEATLLEGELGISPRRRKLASKPIGTVKTRALPADRYMTPPNESL